VTSKKKPDDKNRPFSSALVGLKKKLEEEEAEKKAQKAQGARPPPPKPQTSRPKAPKSDAREDEESFHRMMAGVVPLGEAKAMRLPKGAADASQKRPKPTVEELATRARTEAEEVHEHLRRLVGGGTRFEVQDDGRRVEGRRVDVPPQVVRSLRRGAVPIDARLDLHGLGAGEAQTEVATFLREKHARGERCVLVIHGKGERLPTGKGVLRGEIAAWLSQGKASEHVAAFATAVDEDGGEGAVYVLLRRDLG
jgi:DNA-nicking Smr family endonuclease